MKLYHWVRCSTCRQAREMLVAHGADFDERDFFLRPLDRAELAELVRLAEGVRPLVSVASPTFKRDGRQLEDYRDDELFELVLTEPRLLRRPLLVTDSGAVLTGRKAIADELARPPSMNERVVLHPSVTVPSRLDIRRCDDGAGRPSEGGTHGF